VKTGTIPTLSDRGWRGNKQRNLFILSYMSACSKKVMSCMNSKFDV
jgi:hypothetical protein